MTHGKVNRFSTASTSAAECAVATETVSRPSASSHQTEAAMPASRSASRAASSMASIRSATLYGFPTAVTGSASRTITYFGADAASGTASAANARRSAAETLAPSRTVT